MELGTRTGASHAPQNQEVGHRMSEQEIFNFATIGEIFEDGVSLIFDGQAAATEKHYKVNTSVVFKAGDRVKIFPDSGTYVVEYVVGPPVRSGSTEDGGSGGGSTAPTIIPLGGTAGQALIKLSDADNDYGWGKVPGTLPTGGGKTTVPIKNDAYTDFDVKWGNPRASEVINQYNTAAGNELQFKTDAKGNFFIRKGISGTWKQITVT